MIAGRILMLPKGEYDANKTYNQLDMVLYMGTSWVAKKTCIGIAPTAENSDYWQLLCEYPILTDAQAEKAVEAYLTKDIGQIITTKEVEDGLEFTITDKNGTKTSVVRHGADGEDGIDGKDGNKIHLIESEPDMESEQTGMYDTGVLASASVGDLVLTSAYNLFEVTQFVDAFYVVTFVGNIKGVDGKDYVLTDEDLEEIASMISADDVIPEHNASEEAHPDIRQEISELSKEIDDLKQNTPSSESALTIAQVEALDAMFQKCAYTEDVTTEYEAFKVAFGLTDSSGDDSSETEVTLSSISATYSGGSVLVGTALTDLTDIIVTATYSDGTTKTVTDYTLSGTIVEGNNTVTVSYSGKSTTITVVGYTEETELVNLFDESTITTDTYLNADGATATQTNFATSDYIVVEGGKNYVIQYNSTETYSRTQEMSVLYDDNKTYLSNVQAKILDSDATLHYHIITTSASGYIRFSYLATKSTNIKVFEGSEVVA